MGAGEGCAAPSMGTVPSAPRCAICVYGKEMREKPIEGFTKLVTIQGECHRYPPTVVSVNRGITSDGSTRSAYPRVRGNDWCGEFKRDIHKGD